MPSLATFANAGYPFTISPDLAETVVVVPASPDLGIVEAFLAMMGRFGELDRCRHHGRDRHAGLGRRPARRP